MVPCTIGRAVAGKGGARERYASRIQSSHRVGLAVSSPNLSGSSLARWAAVSSYPSAQTHCARPQSDKFGNFAVDQTCTKPLLNHEVWWGIIIIITFPVSGISMYNVTFRVIIENPCGRCFITVFLCNAASGGAIFEILVFIIKERGIVYQFTQ